MSMRSDLEALRDKMQSGSEESYWLDLDEILASHRDTITTVEELDALADGSAILDGEGDVAQKLSDWWHFPEIAPMGSSKVIKYNPVTLLHDGGAA